MKTKTETKAVPYNAKTKRQERKRILVALADKLPAASKARIKRLADIGICHPTFSMNAPQGDPCGDRPACEFGLAVCGGKCRYPPDQRSDAERGAIGDLNGSSIGKKSVDLDAEQKRRNKIAWQGAICGMVNQPNKLTGAEIARQVAARCTTAGFAVPSLRVMARFANATRQKRTQIVNEHPVAPLGCWQCLRARKARPYNGREKAMERAFVDQGKSYRKG